MKDEEAAVESWKGHLRRHDSIFVDYTQGMHRSHLTCPSCGKESIKYDVYSSISLPLVPSKDRPRIPLKECLDQFTGGEQLDEHNAWYCSRCKKHVCALKLITLWNTPGEDIDELLVYCHAWLLRTETSLYSSSASLDILILHLKRFTFEKCPTHDGRLLKKKIEDKVEFPIDRLDLSDYVLGPKHADAPPVYKVRLSLLLIPMLS
jgi:ubiquitin carboxyl-terminal hydrolase 8